MNVTLAPTTPADRVVLDNLWQLYVHDFSEQMHLPLRDDGRFEGRAFDVYWTDPWRHAFLLRVDGGLAGFALIQERSRLTGASGVQDMVEFFVARGYRRRGVGQRAAVAAFERFRGPWEVRQQPTSVAATTFWRRVIGGYTGGAQAVGALAYGTATATASATPATTARVAATATRTTATTTASATPATSEGRPRADRRGRVDTARYVGGAHRRFRDR